MYVDHDSNQAISIMEVSDDECYILTEALIRLATNPNIPVAERERAKKLAYLINQENENTRNADGQRAGSPSHQQDL